MDARRLRLMLIVPPIAALLLGGISGYLLKPNAGAGAPDPQRIANDVLLSVRDHGRLTPFAGRFVAVVTAKESRFGLDARKTLIMPGTIRYSVDLSRLKRRDLDWDRETSTLSVTLPSLEISGPDIDLNEVQEYSEGGIVMALTDAEQTIDQANHRSAQEDLMRQARARLPLSQARNVAMRSVARSFAMPLRAAGIEASVAVRFVDPAGQEEAFFLDRPRSIEDAVQDRRAGPSPEGKKK
jgi:hypothetical protein